MEWNEIFRGYNDIKKDQNKIYSFCTEDDNWLPELQHVFLHETQSEMFILVDITKNIEKLLKSYNITYEDSNKVDMKNSEYQFLLEKVIKNWEQLILNFINFEWDNEEKRKFLKYNITLIILCCREKIDNESILSKTNAIIREERSTSVCRKIFIFNEDDELNYLPFYFENIKNSSSIESITIEIELKKLVKETKSYLYELSKYEVEKSNDEN